MSSRASLNSWGEGVSLALVGHPSSNGVTIKMPSRVDVLHNQFCTPIFPIGLVITESGFIVRSIETGIRRWMLVVAVISVDAYPFFGFLRPDLSPWGYRNRCFLVVLCCLIVRRLNLDVATKKLLRFSAMFLHGSVSLQLFMVVWMLLRYLGVICYDRQVVSEGHKNYFKDWCLINSKSTFLFLTYLNLCIMAILSKACKPDSFFAHLCKA